jgi:hypothetical protein
VFELSNRHSADCSKGNSTRFSKERERGNGTQILEASRIPCKFGLNDICLENIRYFVIHDQLKETLFFKAVVFNRE